MTKRESTRGPLTIKPALLLMALLIIHGCSAKRIYQGVYEGTRVRNQTGTTPAEETGKEEHLDYNQYETLRGESMKKKKDAR